MFESEKLKYIAVKEKINKLFDCTASKKRATLSTNQLK